MKTLSALAFLFVAIIAPVSSVRADSITVPITSTQDYATAALQIGEFVGNYRLIPQYAAYTITPTYFRGSLIAVTARSSAGNAGRPFAQTTPTAEALSFSLIDVLQSWGEGGTVQAEVVDVYFSCPFVGPAWTEAVPLTIPAKYNLAPNLGQALNLPVGMLCPAETAYSGALDSSGDDTGNQNQGEFCPDAPNAINQYCAPGLGCCSNHVPRPGETTVGHHCGSCMLE